MPDASGPGSEAGAHNELAPYDLASLRGRIDDLDRQLVDLLNERAKVSLQVGIAKRTEAKPGSGASGAAASIPIYVPDREAEVYERVLARSTGPLPPDGLRAIYSEILSSSRSLQRTLTVAFLGPEHTFGHQAALAHFGRSTRLVPVPTHPDVFQETELGRVDYGVVAIENSTDGPVGATLDSFVESDLKACAEVRLDIHQALMSKVPLDQIRVVYSHPSSLGQCRQWLRAHLPELPQVEMASNVAAVARAAQEEQAAALGPESAGGAYGLQILESHCEDVAGNTTRVLVIGRQMAERTGRDRMALLFSVRDRVGVLRDVLALFAGASINLTKIESRPSKRRAWDYLFFVDLDAHPEDPAMVAALRDLQDLTVFVKVLGAWPRRD